MAARNRHRSSASSGNVAKRQKTEASDDFSEFALQAIASLNKLFSGDYQIVNDFLTLPSNKLYPDYYVEIKSPISIQEIKSKVTSKAYSSLAQFLSDFRLMSDNAKQFNDESSDIAKNAETIYNSIREQVDEFNASQQVYVPPALPKIKIKLTKPKQESEKPELGVIDLKEKLLELVDNLSKFQDNDINIAEPFLFEVSRKEYPDYYKLIKQAMSFDTIKKNISSNKYSNLEDFKKHLDLIWTNAQLYNEEDSLIYQDSKTLQNVADEKINELKALLDSASEKEKGTPLDHGADDIVATASASEQNEDGDADHDDDDDGEEEEEQEGEEEEEREDDEDEALDEDSVASGNEVDAGTLEENLNPFAATSEPSSYLKTIKKATYTNPQTQIKPQDALIQEITISSSRSIYRQIVRASSVPTQGTLPAFQNWFEYRVKALDNLTKTKPKSYSLVLPSNSAGSISVSASLNDSLTKKKHVSALSINGERVNPQPSIHYSDPARQLTSRYELKIPSGLNNIKFTVSIGAGDKYDPDDLLKPYNAQLEESIIFWVQVA
jgi:ribosomal protein L12E/L44/L45/RPP1/RPP2